MASIRERLAYADRRTLCVLRPFDKREAITLGQAADIAGRVEGTVRTWVDHCGIGRHVAGSVMVSHPALLIFLDDDVTALEAYLAGIAAGVYAGKRRKPSVDTAKVRQLQATGLGATEIATQLEIGRASVYRVLNCKNSPLANRA